MSTTGIQIPTEQPTFGRASLPVAIICSMCLGAVVYATVYLQGTLLGFALAFGGGAIAIECLIVLQGLSGYNVWRGRQ
jgi:hypothetical protein